MNLEFAKHLALRSIHLHECSQRRGEGAPDAMPTMETEATLSLVKAPDDCIAYTVKMDYGIRNASQEDVLQGDVTYVAVYELEDGFELTEQQIEAYAFGGVAFQVHPYLREHVATMCQRAGLVGYPLAPLVHDPSRTSASD